MSVTPSEWPLLRALAWHRVMLVQRGGRNAKAAATLKGGGLLSTARLDESRAVIRITDDGLAMVAKIEKE